jgi:long-chain acyl-CoA synthetase
MSGVVLVTGATGFLGTQIIRQLLADTDHTVIALVRAADKSTAEMRLRRAWWDWPELDAEINSRVTPFPGDVSLSNLGLPDALVVRLTHIIHAAADLRLDAPLVDLRRTNVDGTARVLELARRAHADHPLERLAYVSTAYVCGRREGSIAEDDLTDAFGFWNAYEQSKYEGEQLVRHAAGELRISIFRPGMVVGDSRTGWVRTFNTAYVPLRLYLTGKLRVIPASHGRRLNLVQVDEVATAIVRLTFDPRAVGQTFHLTAPPDQQPTIAELLRAVQAWSREHLGVVQPQPWFIPPTLFNGAERWAARGTPQLRWLLPYFGEQRQFRRDKTVQLLDSSTLDWRALVPTLLTYATDKGFLHRSGRTVHEQIVFRLTSRRRPVTYRDWVEGAVVIRSGADLRREILQAAAALRALGVCPGDRVAVVGLNSTRYLAIDVAIGLIGAVSVPLYYTNPPAEIDGILASSGAQLLFVGAPAVLARLEELHAAIPVVSFSRGAAPKHVTTWEDFLAQGAGNEAADPVEAPVGPDDIATIRYTSGTTGPPKGVVFTHRQLRWMAETVAGLLPWATRTTPATYLSFLPLNHVVEGILGTYAPYYLPTAVHVSFLEQLTDLPAILPRVRPTVFFAVPRIYERLWESIRTNPIGRRYLAAHHRLARTWLRSIVRRQALRRAGFSRCRWLIAGSAPVDVELLRALSQLGIEVHNAYGLTEAPLVAINRCGDNRIGTVGRLLPETELRVADDGELLVRGPQVTSGYFDTNVDSPFRDGWLLTGDLGHLTAEGLLVIDGRKKDLIATAYGKKIQATKVETLLRQIPSVAEALLVGEGRPYCVALLWLQEGTPTNDVAGLDAAVAAVNGALAHPEQVKRWAVLANDLSIERGDLTANFKLRRETITGRCQTLIDALYDQPDSSALTSNVLHVGSARREEAVTV